MKNTHAHTPRQGNRNLMKHSLFAPRLLRSAFLSAFRLRVPLLLLRQTILGKVPDHHGVRVRVCGRAASECVLEPRHRVRRQEPRHGDGKQRSGYSGERGKGTGWRTRSTARVGIAPKQTFLRLKGSTALFRIVMTTCILILNIKAH